MYGMRINLCQGYSRLFTIDRMDTERIFSSTDNDIITLTQHSSCPMQIDIMDNK